MAVAVWVSTVFNGYGNKYFEEPIDAVSFDERDLMDLGRIITGADEKGASLFLKKCTYNCILHSQQGRLKSHLGSTNPVEGFKRSNII